MHTHMHTHIHTCISRRKAPCHAAYASTSGTVQPSPLATVHCGEVSRSGGWWRRWGAGGATASRDSGRERKRGNLEEAARGGRRLELLDVRLQPTLQPERREREREGVEDGGAWTVHVESPTC